VALLGLAAAGVASPALAGPASYDPKTRSFTFSYTFASLSTTGPTLNLAQAGQVQTPTKEQDDTVRALVKLVSDVMEQATQGRGKIGTCKFVDTIKDADLVISLTGQPGSPGWAMLRSIDGNPGQMALYYESLKPRIRQEVVYTAVHEIFHYVFGLADEYDHSKFPGGCPPGSGKPGCLMDNYNSPPPPGRGYMGRLCQPGEHNSTPAQVKSCQEIVDEFFSQHGVTEKVKGDDTKPFIADDRTTVIASTVAQVQGRVQDDIANGRRRPTASGLVSEARETLKEVIALFNSNNNDKVTMTRQQIEKAARLIAQSGAVTPTAKPVGLTDQQTAQIDAEAKRVGDEVAADARKSESSRVSTIRTHLRQFVDELVKTNNIDRDAFTREDQAALVEQLARREGQSPEARKLSQTLDRLRVEGDLGLEMSRTIAEFVVQTLDELDAPGTPKRLEILSRFDDRLKQLSIPGRTAAEWGMRRSRFITPSVSRPEYEFVETQGGVFPYSKVRDRGFEDFSRLIDRARIELVRPTFAIDTDRRFGPIAPRIDRPFELESPQEAEARRKRRNEDFSYFLNEIFQQLERNRLENIAILVPPDGLPPDIDDTLRVLQSKLPPSLDARLDLVLVGPVDLSTELRHLSVKSRGSVLTVADMDEIGSIAQRLRDEQSSGAWVMIPQQSTIPQRAPRGLSATPGDDLERLRARARDKWGEVAARIDAVRLDLEDARNIARDRTQADQLRVDNVIGVTNRLRDAFEQLDLILQDADPALGDPARADFRAVNLRYMQHIGQAGLVLEAAQTFMRESIEAPGSDPVTIRLRQVATGLVSPDSLGIELRAAAELLRLHERSLEMALLATRDNLPIYARLDRGNVEFLRRLVEARAIGGGGENMLDKLAPLADPTDLADPNFPVSKISKRIRLARFYAEGNSDFELILGLSRPLPRFLVPGTNRTEPTPVDTKLVLYSDQGAPVDGTSMLRYNRAKSTDTLHVWTAEGPDRRLPAGWYTPFLTLDERTMKELKENEINFTFSVGSTRDNIQLIASLIEEPNDRDRGTVRRAEGQAIVEVQVLAGSPVRRAHVVGFAQRLVPGSNQIVTQQVDFNDDGPEGGILRQQLGNRPAVTDRVKDDGIYTGAISIADIGDEGAEIRIFLQGETIENQSRFIALDDPMQGQEAESSAEAEERTTTTGSSSSVRNRRREATREAVRQTARALRAEVVRDTEAAQGALPFKFQRATSLHFRVEP
jgi:hypothetical protein